MAASLSKNNNIPAGINPVPGTTSIGVYDSGSIMGHTQPGGSAVKLTDGTQQSAASLVAGTNANGVDGNFIDVANDPTYRGPAAGYSILGE